MSALALVAATALAAAFSPSEAEPVSTTTGSYSTSSGSTPADSTGSTSPGLPGLDARKADKYGPKKRHRKVKLPPHFVFANHYGLTLGLDPTPSGDIALFFGRALPALAPSRAHQRWALGYQLTLSVGNADRYFLSGFTQRHHLTAVSYGTLRPRLYAAVGGGLAIFSGWYRPVNPKDWRPSVAEVEGRLGYIFGRRRDHRRLVGVVGGTARIGWNAASLEKAPVPQIGAFLGFLVR